MASLSEVQNRLPDIQLFGQTILYFTQVLLGFSAAITLGITSNNFDGNCLLYASVDWKDSANFTVDFGDQKSCGFCVYITVFCGIMYAFGMACYFTFAVVKSYKDPSIGSQMWVLPFILANTMVAALAFVAASMVSVGFHKMCGTLTKGEPVSSCQSGQDIADLWNKNRPPGHKDYKPDSFFSFLTTAQTTSWLGVLCWAVQVGLGGLRLYRNRQLRLAGGGGGDPSSIDTAAIMGGEPPAAPATASPI